MVISDPCVVGLRWTLADAQGHTIDELRETVDFFFGGSDLLPKVEEALFNHVAGEEVFVQLEPEHAFGDYRSELVCFEARALFPEQLEVGMRFEGLPAGAATPGMPADAIYTVTEIYPEHVVLDGNHPLAGMALRLRLQVMSVREASAEEEAAATLGSAGISVLNTLPSGPHTH